MISASAWARARHEVGRLEHDRVAVGQRRRDLPGGNCDRKIPGRDDADDADRLARRLDVDVGPERRRISRREFSTPRRRRNRRSGRRGPPRQIASGSVLPSSRASSRPSSSRRARISVEARSRMSWRSCGVVRAQAGKAACAAWTAASVWAASAWAYSPTTSLVSDGLMLRETPAPVHPFAGDDSSCAARSCRSHRSLTARHCRAGRVQINPRRARLRISAPAPNVQRSHSSHGRMRLTSRPSFSAPMRDDVARLVGEAHAGRAAIGDRREHRAEQTGPARRDRRGSAPASARRDRRDRG